MISRDRASFIRFARNNSVEYGDPFKGLTTEAGAIKVLYTSHMFEHLDPHEAVMFLKEAKRVLCAGGTLRLAVPDIRVRA